MMIEWKTRGISYHVASVGLLTLNVMTAPGSDGEHWAIYVDDSDSSATRAQVQERFVGTLDEAKARAIELATALVAPLVAEATAAERAAHAEEVRVLEEKLAAVYGGLTHAAESGPRYIADATAAEREAVLAIIDAETTLLESLESLRPATGPSVLGWRIDSLRAVRDKIAARSKDGAR